MDRRPIAVALAGIAVIAIFAGIAGTLHASAAPSPSFVAPAVRPAATDNVHTTNCNYGSFQFDWYVAAGQNRVCFYAYDPVDSTATVAIYDQNYTRDALTSPVDQWTVNTSSTTNWSYQSNLFYSIPLTLAYGGYWNISITGATAGVSNSSFYVHTYGVSLSPNARVYLPHHMAQVFYNVIKTVNSAPESPITTLQAVGSYVSSVSGNTTSIWSAPQNLPLMPVGSFNVTIPTDIAAGNSVFIEVWANVTTSHMNNTEASDAFLQIGALAPVQVNINGCFGGCGGGYGYPAGTLLEATVTSSIQTYFGGMVAAVGLQVKMSFTAGNTPVTTVPGNPPLTGTTDSNGQFSIVFLANASVFSTTKVNTLSVNVTDPLDSTTWRSADATFFVAPPAPNSAALSVTTPLAQYYSGDAITATWTIGPQPGGTTAGWVADTWGVTDTANGYVTLAQGAIASTGLTGTFAYTVPAHYTGELQLWVSAHNSTAQVYGFVDVGVTQPTILLTPNEGTYNPGDHLSVQIATDGTELTGATLYGTITGSSPSTGGTQYFSGVVSGSQLTLNVPKVDAPQTVRFDVFAQSPTLGVIATQSLDLMLAYGLQLTAGVTTPSAYTDGSYQPGQSVQVHYQISSVNQAPLPKSFTIEIILGLGFGAGTSNTQYVSTTSSSGSFTVTIPSSAASGAQFVEIFASGSGCVPSCNADTLFGILVNSQPSALNYELGAGSGITVGWIVLLVLILVVGFFVWRVARRGKGSRPVMMSPSTGDGSSASPPASPPSYSEGPAPDGSGTYAGGPASSTDAPAGSPPLPRPPNQG